MLQSARKIMQIEQRVALEPKYFDTNINEHLFNKLKTLMEGNSYTDYGYIIEVKNLIKILNNVIVSSNSDVIFHVICEVDTIKPTEGSIITESISRITEDGIFIDLFNTDARNNGNIIILIPTSSYKSKDAYLVGMKINVKIVFVKYDKKQYKCIGNIVE